MKNSDNYLFNKSNSGFTLVELSVVLLIIALVAGSGIAVGKSALESAQTAATYNRLNTIETALSAFRQNGRLPCPADGSLASSNANYGSEAANIGSCTGGAPAANFQVTISGSKTVEGVVPVRTLSLPDEFMFDGWGRKITYSVWAPMTGMRAFYNYGVNFNCGMITTRDASGGIRSSQGIYVLLSEGKNGHGGYTVQGTKNSNGSVNTDERTNCHCDGAAADTGYAATYVMKDATESPTNTLDQFDDLLRFKERWQMQSAADINNPDGGFTCPQSLPGIRFYGPVGSRAGSAVAAGDINGDGIQDLIIGARGLSGGAGAVYVVFGKASYTNPYDLTTLNGTTGFRIDGINANDQTGWSVASGDINGDGVADVVIGANAADPSALNGAGSVFVVFGSKSTWASTFALTGIDGTNGIRIDGVTAGDEVGQSVAAGDVTGDGFADIIIGAKGYNSGDGGVYAVFGAATYARSQYTLNNNGVTGIIPNTAATGYRIQSIGSSEQMGYSVATGDINGDGLGDIVIGHRGYNTSSGLVSMYLGKGRGSNSTPVKAENLNGRNGFHLQGGAANNQTGAAVAVGDVNGDGMGDIIVGANGATASGRATAGITYVLYGNNSRKYPIFKVANFNATNGYEIHGAAATNVSGTAVAVGDINADGVGDVLTGANAASPGGRAAAGSSYIVFNASTAPGTIFDLLTINGTNGFQLDGGTAGDNSGEFLATGDINGDGKGDAIVGAPAANGTAGYVYVYFGQQLTTAWTNPYNLGGL